LSVIYGEFILVCCLGALPLVVMLNLFQYLGFGLSTDPETSSG
jgi:hypothetical protein